MPLHRPIAYIKKDLELKLKEQAQLNKEVDALEKQYNKALMSEDLHADKIGEAFADKKALSIGVDKEVQKLQKELKDERNRLNSLGRD